MTPPRLNSFTKLSPSAKFKRIGVLKKSLDSHPFFKWSSPDSKKKMNNSLKRRLQITPSNSSVESLRDKKLNKFQDLSLTIQSRISFNQRKNMKKFFQRYKMDIFCQTEAVQNLIEEVSNVYKYSTISIELADGKKFDLLYLKNIQEVLEWRCQKLYRRKKLINFDKLGGKLILGLCGDKGANYFKLGLVLANTPSPNNPQNFILIGLYEGNLKIVLKFSD